MLNFLIEKDQQLLIYLNNLGSGNWDATWLIITNKFTAIPLYLLLIFILFKKYGFKVGALSLVAVVLLITCSAQVCNLFKYGIERLRPCHDQDVKNLIRHVKPSCGGRYGFFSAHASNSAAIAVFFGFLFRKHYKNLLYILLVWAIVVSYSRVYLGVHYPLDVLCGFASGSVIAYVFYKLVKVVMPNKF